MQKFIVFFFLSFTTVPLVSFAEDVIVVTDGAVDNFKSSSISSMHRVNDSVFFSQSSSLGNELWKTQGNTLSTSLVSDIKPGPAGSNPLYFTQVGNTVYFTADDGVHGRELWRSDGTQAGTVMVSDILPGEMGSRPKGFVVLGDKIFFTAFYEKRGIALWESDGTKEGTRILDKSHEIYAQDHAFVKRPIYGLKIVGDELQYVLNRPFAFKKYRIGDSKPTKLDLDRALGPKGDFVVAGGRTYFLLQKYQTGVELWVTDGTNAGTRIVKDINPGRGSSSPRNLTVFGRYLYFRASDGGDHSQLWKTDLKTGLTARVFLNAPWSRLGYFEIVKHQEKLFFTAVDHNDIEQLWVTDKLGNIRRVTNFTDDNMLINFFDCDSEHFYFSAGSLYEESKVWKTDGTPGGTKLLKDQQGRHIYDDSEGLFVPPKPVATVGGKDLFFARAFESSEGRKLWAVESGSTDAHRPYDVQIGLPGKAVNVLNKTFFVGYSGATGAEIFAFDHTTQESTLVADLVVGEKGSFPKELTYFGGNLYFTALNRLDERELWKFRIADAALNRVKYPGRNYKNPLNLSADDEFLYFSIDYVSGTYTSRSFHRIGRDHGEPRFLFNKNRNYSAEFFSFKDSFYFADQAWGNPNWNWFLSKPYEKNGNKNIELNVSNSSADYPRDFVKLNDAVFFTAPDRKLGNELWKTDGTQAGTQVLSDIFSGRFGSDPTELTAVGDSLFFAAENDSSGFELWKSDGTAAGTSMLKDIKIGENSSKPHMFKSVHGKLYFLADDASGKSKLWMSDGTAAGTIRLSTMYPDLRSASTDIWGGGNNIVYIGNWTKEYGYEIWAVDHANRKASLVKDLLPGYVGSMARIVGVFDSYLVVHALDGNGNRTMKKVSI